MEDDEKSIQATHMKIISNYGTSKYEKREISGTLVRSNRKFNCNIKGSTGEIRGNPRGNLECGAAQPCLFKYIFFKKFAFKSKVKNFRF
jgi:hypothetical protein